MKNIIVSIVLLFICVALIVGVVLPLAEQIRTVGQKCIESVADLGDSIAEDTL